MDDLHLVLQTKDVQKISFYIENAIMLREIYEKRQLCTKSIDDEMQQLLNRYRQITGKQYNI